MTLREEYGAGATTDELAEKYGVHQTTMRKSLLKAGVKFRRRGPRLLAPSKRILRIIAARKSGKTLASIGARHGVTKQCVHQLLARYAA